MWGSNSAIKAGDVALHAGRSAAGRTPGDALAPLGELLAKIDTHITEAASPELVTWGHATGTMPARLAAQELGQARAMFEALGASVATQQTCADAARGMEILAKIDIRGASPTGVPIITKSRLEKLGATHDDLERFRSAQQRPNSSDWKDLVESWREFTVESANSAQQSLVKDWMELRRVHRGDEMHAARELQAHLRSTDVAKRLLAALPEDAPHAQLANVAQEQHAALTQQVDGLASVLREASDRIAPFGRVANLHQVVHDTSVTKLEQEAEDVARLAAEHAAYSIGNGRRDDDQLLLDLAKRGGPVSAEAQEAASRLINEMLELRRSLDSSIEDAAAMVIARAQDLGDVESAAFDGVEDVARKLERLNGDLTSAKAQLVWFHEGSTGTTGGASPYPAALTS